MCSVRTRPFIASFVALLLLLTAACGGDDGDATPTDAAPASGSGDSDDTDTDNDTDDAESDPDEDAAGGSGSEGAAPVCDLLTDAELSAAVGYDVDSKAPEIGAMPTCTWTLDVPHAADTMPMWSQVTMTLLPRDELRFRVTAGEGELYQPVDGVGDEAYMAFVPPLEENLAAMVQFYALEGDQGFVLIPSISKWTEQDAAEADLVELGNLILDRL